MGSTSTLEVTSRSRVAVTSQISLCLMMTYPPLAQLRAWLVSFCFPQTVWSASVSQGQSVIECGLCKVKPCSSIGKTISHADAPFSCATPQLSSWLKVVGPRFQLPFCSSGFCSFLYELSCLVLFCINQVFISTTVSSCIFHGMADGCKCGI